MAPSKEVSYDGYTTLAVSLKGHVLHVALDRVKKLNAWSPEMWVEFKQVFIKAGSDPRVRGGYESDVLFWKGTGMEGGCVCSSSGRDRRTGLPLLAPEGKTVRAIEKGL